MQLTDRAANMEIVRQALREAAPKARPQPERIGRQKFAYVTLVVLLSALLGAVVTLLAIDQLRPMTAERAVQLNALVRMAANLRHMSAKAVWRDLRVSQGIGGDQEIGNREAAALIRAAIRMIDAHDNRD